MTKTKRLMRVIPAVLALGVINMPALAAVELVAQDTKTVGDTTVTWDSSFQDLSYTLGDTIVLPVTWQIDAGSGSFSSFTLRGPQFTPKGPDPARGELVSVQLVQDSSSPMTEGRVDVAVQFTELHCDLEREVEIGNGHFSLLLNTTEGVVAYGVNVHVEDPGACASPARGGGRPAASEGRGQTSQEAER